MKAVERSKPELILELSAPPSQPRRTRQHRRRHLRVVPEPGRPIRVDINGVDFLDIMYASSFSEGGLSVKVNHAFSRCDIGLPVSLIVSLPEPFRQDLLLTGKIRHVGNDLFGIAFLQISRKHRAQIRQYIRHRLRHEPWRIRLSYFLRNLFSAMGHRG